MHLFILTKYCFVYRQTYSHHVTTKLTRPYEFHIFFGLGLRFWESNDAMQGPLGFSK